MLLKWYSTMVKHHLQERNCGMSTDANKLRALRYLLIQLVLQVLLRPGDFSEASSELIICCKKAFATPDLLDSSGDDETDGDGVPALMDVLLDTLLSLLPESSAPMRSAIEQVIVRSSIYLSSALFHMCTNCSVFYLSKACKLVCGVFKIYQACAYKLSV